MKCFNHRQADALATCKHCCRALCQDCLTDVRGAVSCRGTCEGPVAAMVDATQALPQLRQQTGKAVLVSAGMLVLLSLVCAAIAWSIGLSDIQNKTLVRALDLSNPQAVTTAPNHLQSWSPNRSALELAWQEVVAA